MLEAQESHLADVPDWPSEIAIIPYSGIQFLDFGFDFHIVAFRPKQFVERIIGQQGENDLKKLIPLTGDPDQDDKLLAGERDDDDHYDVKSTAALEPFLNKWTPIPVLRRKQIAVRPGERKFHSGPSAWARVRVVELPRPDTETGHTHRVQIALDTGLMAEANDDLYVAPTRRDAEARSVFELVADPTEMDWFLRRPSKQEGGPEIDLQKWASDWLYDHFFAAKQAQRPGREVLLPHSFEHWARFLTFLEFLKRATPIPSMRLVNTVGAEDESVKPVQVDLVLDIGNSRTCGILIERFPDSSHIDLNKSYPLVVRDLGHPEFTYSGLLESRVEFDTVKFGIEQYEKRSFRGDAFIWPSIVRTGPEAMRLVGVEDGTETTSGLSSPKRYLWDESPTQQNWRFHSHDEAKDLPKPVRRVMRSVNEAGDVIDQIIEEEQKRLRPRGASSKTGAMRARFSRSSMFCFMLAEIISHALLQINDPASRNKRQQSELPRRLSRIILTLPTATPAQEQAIIRSRAKAALKLVWQMMGVKETDSGHTVIPELVVEWDEASCTQLVHLYSDITQRFAGRIDEYFRLRGSKRPASPGATAENSLRVACIDVGGGTTDLMITTYFAEDNKLIKPQQNFREGFRIAGDDLVQAISSSIVIPQIRNSIENAGTGSAHELMQELFAGDVGGQDQRSAQLRRQFGLRLIAPLAIAVLEGAETADEFDRVVVSAADRFGLPVEPSSSNDANDETPPVVLDVPERLLRYVEEPAKRLCGENWQLSDLTIDIDRAEVDAVVQTVFNTALERISEVIHHLSCDLVLITGRPSRLPAFRSILEESMMITPDRLISMHAYRTGPWYPYRDPATDRIKDPKSTVVVGAMLIALASNRISNFKVMTEAFRMKSIARFIGEMDQTGQIPSHRVLFSDMDLDRKTNMDEEAQVKLYSPIHIGARQLPLERWITTPLYELDFGNEAASRRLPPLTVTLIREPRDDDAEDQDQVLRLEALNEAFKVDYIEDGDQTPLRTSDVRLRLQTLGVSRDYWLDTGIFRMI